MTTDTTTVTRGPNSKNELIGDGEATLGYDKNGNTTTDENGNTLTYDAWNRMVTDSAGTTSCTYDANGRRITETHGSTTTSLYFSVVGQIIEEHVAGSVTAQNVFNVDYVNDLLFRDDSSTSGSLGKSDSGLGDRVYYQHDANFNVTATISNSGDVIQRYAYTPYGVQTVLTVAWGTSSNSNSIYGFQDGRYDVATGLNHFGSPGRDYNPMTGGWIESDSAYFDGLNLYWACSANPVLYVDPSGNDPAPTTQPTTGPTNLNGLYGGLNSDDFHTRGSAYDDLMKQLISGGLTQDDLDALNKRGASDKQPGGGLEVCNAVDRARADLRKRIEDAELALGVLKRKQQAINAKAIDVDQRKLQSNQETLNDPQSTEEQRMAARADNADTTADLQRLNDERAAMQQQAQPAIDEAQKNLDALKRAQNSGATTQPSPDCADE